MKEVIKQEEIKKFNHYGAIYTVFLVIAVISAAPLFYIGNKWTVILWCVIALAAMYFATKIEQIKRAMMFKRTRKQQHFVKVKGWMKSREPENTANVLIKRFYGLSEVLQQEQLLVMYWAFCCNHFDNDTQ